MSEVEKEPLEMVVGDFYSGHTGNELALVSIQRNILMIYHDQINHSWHLEKLWQDSESVRDIEISDILPDRPGSELVVVGYSNFAHVIFSVTPKMSSRVHSGRFGCLDPRRNLEGFSYRVRYPPRRDAETQNNMSPLLEVLQERGVRARF